MGSAYTAQCPPTLSENQLLKLHKTEQIEFGDTVFLLDGSSRKILASKKKVTVDRNTVPYVQAANGKIACWYKTSHGYIGVKEK
jgi:hypothetical protein